VIYMEEAKGEASGAALGVNATDMQGTARASLFRPMAHARRECLVANSLPNADEKSYSYGKSALRLVTNF
jgi:hypothetical protein